MAAILLAGIGLLLSTHDLQSSATTLILQSQDVLQSSEHILSLAKDIESGQRGYLITSDAAYLKPYDTALEQLPEAMAHLSSACKTPEIKQLVRSIGDLINQRQRWAAELVEAHRQGSAGREKAIIHTARGQRLMDELRRQVTALQQQETAYIVAREEETMWAKRKTRILAVILVLVGGLASLVASAQARRQRLLKECANDKLVQRTHELERLHAVEAQAHERARNLNDDLAAANRRAEEAITARARILATITEEVRTPLRSIAALSSTITDQASEKNLDSSNDIRSTAAALVQLLDDVLEFTRPGDGKLTLRIGPFNLRAVCAEVCSIMRVSAADKNLAVTLDYGQALPEMFVGDGQCVRQVLTHLLSNAVKFTFKGSVACAVTSNGASGDGVRISITDTGIGIAPDKLPTMFLPFPEAVRTHGFDGSGLGLSICKELVELMGGEISVSSTQGKGTTFVVTLWINPAKPESAIEPLRDKAVELFRSMKILISDKDVSTQTFCRTMFEKLGASVDIVRTGPESVSACGLKPYDLLLADCSLPESEAFKAAKDLRRLGIAKRLHIVGIASDVTAEIRQRCLDAGMDECVIKPPNAAALVNLLAVCRSPAG